MWKLNLVCGRSARRRPPTARSIGANRRVQSGLSGIAALSLAVLAAACGTRPAATGTAAAPLTNPLTLRSAQLVTGNTGWVLTRDALGWTTDGGLRWTAITPPGVPASAIRGVYFLSPSLGWVVSALPSNPGQLQISTTRTGGAAWSTSAVGQPVPGTDPGLPAYVDFTDAQHGWVVSMIADNANFATGLLFVTTNGGQTWRMRQMPVGGPVEFVNATTGWLSDERPGGLLYVTSNGGRTWQAATVKAPPGYSQGQAAYAIPTFTRPGKLVIAAFDNGTASAAGIYATSDAGTTWRLVAAIPAARPAVGFVLPAAAIAGPGQWLAVEFGARLIAGMVGHGIRPSPQVSSGLPSSSGTGFSDASFTGTGATWVITDTSACTGFKTGCREITALWHSSDFGAHWTMVNVP
jgi:photosystem II stability/assembly factor-like uncharacterized protein